MTRHLRVAIIGSGFGGLGTAITLKDEGIDDFLVFERADDLGGTWRDNSYPGCACDVPSHLYSFSFAPNPEWSRSFSPQEEIWAYLRRCVERFGIGGHLRFGHEVHAARWLGDRWEVETSGGTWTADVLVSAAGPLHEPSIPALPGAETFAGTAFHSARWDHDHDLTGSNVAVIGTGASAIQFVPQIAPEVGKLSIFQRSAPWIVPRGDRALTRFEHSLFRRVPLAQKLARAAIFTGQEATAVGFLRPRLGKAAELVARRHLRRSVRDPELRARLKPDYSMGCKRVLRSDDYFPALTRDNVDLVTTGIAAIRPHGIVTTDGVEHPIDTIIYGTGFHVTDSPIADRIAGRDGKTLADVWQGSPVAHLGTTVAGFPNLFLLLGPSTGLGHTTVVYMLESQLAHLRGALRHLAGSDGTSIEPRPEAQQAFRDEMDRRVRGTVWDVGGCSSWYIDRTGRNSVIWPSFASAFRRRVRHFDPADYATHHAEELEPAAEGQP
jgi:cation diffusion facilitator CzcD-associated flavoprotein CzcO